MAGVVFVGCGGAAFQSDGDDSGGEGSVGGSASSGGTGGKGSGGSSSGSAGKGSGGASGGGAGGATGGTQNTGGTGNTGNTGGSEGGSVAVGGTSGRGGAGGSGALGGTGNPGGSAGTSGSAGSGGTGAMSTEQWASEYEQGCEFDANCSLVVQGDKCGCPNCDNGAVNHGVLAQYQSDWEAIQCPMGGPDVICPEIACQEQLASCSKEGKCYARTPTYIDGANYPKSCQLPGDCHVIITGEVCASCRCATAAVNQEGYDQYLSDIDGIDCNPGQNPCDCAPQLDATCLIDVMGGGIGECVVGVTAASE
jgi:hypothetical protein